MDIDMEAFGKVIGMFMAYAVSFLGLVLAYFSYKKRGPRTDDFEEHEAAVKKEAE